jgi:hypothetical protein
MRALVVLPAAGASAAVVCEMLVKCPAGSWSTDLGQAVQPAARTALGDRVDVLPSPLKPANLPVEDRVDRARLQARRFDSSGRTADRCI